MYRIERAEFIFQQHNNAQYRISEKSMKFFVEYMENSAYRFM
jgi:hypothetical protein